MDKPITYKGVPFEADKPGSLVTIEAAALERINDLALEQTARIATLEAELAEARADVEAERLRASDWMARVDSADHEGCAWMERANALRDALDNARAFIATAQSADAFHEWAVDTKNGGLDVHAALVRCNAALAQTPAASLAAHDAEVLERARDAAHNAIHDAAYEMGECARIKAAVDDAIRALAAQEVKP